MDFTDYSPKDQQLQVTDQQLVIPDCFRGLEESCNNLLSDHGVDLSTIKYKYSTPKNNAASYIFTLTGEKSGGGRSQGHRIMARLSYSPVRRTWSVGYIDDRDYVPTWYESVLKAFYEQLKLDAQIYITQRRSQCKT